jgi:hypothetical protein
LLSVSAYAHFVRKEKAVTANREIG